MRLPLEMESNNNITATKVEEPVQVMMKDPKKVAAGKRLTEFNCKRKEELDQKSKDQESEPNLSQAYDIGAVIAVGVLGLCGYYIYQRGSPGDNNAKVTLVRSVETRENKFEME